MDRYPFLIRAPGTTRKRLVHIVAANYKQALNVILSTIPSKFISTKFARNMDLISAKVEAAKASRTKNKQVWIVTNDRDGECAISLTEETNKGWTVYTSYKNGSEIALTPAAEQTRKDKPVTTIKIKSVKKQIDPRVTIMEKVAKKAAPAKASKKVGGKPVGKLIKMTVKAVKDKVVKGFKAFNASGKPLPIAYLNKAKDVSREMEVTIVAAEKA